MRFRALGSAPTGGLVDWQQGSAPLVETSIPSFQTQTHPEQGIHESIGSPHQVNKRDVWPTR